MLTIKNLYANVNGKSILKDFNLEIKEGEVHAIMGPNGSGKSTLSYVLAGKPGYEVTSGSVEYMGQNLLNLDVSQRALLGLFLAFQYPVEIAGVNNAYFLRAALNAKLKHQGKDELDSGQFLSLAREHMKILDMDQKYLTRYLNDGFSGGEKKRNEILQLRILEPNLAILDETDSGLDIDALKLVAEGVNGMRNLKRSFIIITHYQRLLDYIQPDYVHVLANGTIVKSGTKDLALKLEDKGYDWISETQESGH